jgi:signal recognition particle subunit SRP54
MFETLNKRLQETLKRVRGEGRLTDANIGDALREVRMALLEADVALPVAKEFLEQVRTRALGQEVLASLTPGQAFVKIVHDELVVLMGEANKRLELAVKPPAIVLLAGLQGTGKTTTAGKLARFLKEREGKSVMLASVDVYRPAAIEQLRRLASQVGAEFFEAPSKQPVEIARAAIEESRRRQTQVLIVDSAGRLHIDEEMMQEIRAVHAALAPTETLFVVDSMAGQDAVNTARAFNEALPITGVILTKTDGDARGGAALSVRKVTGKPIKFLGIGEKSEALEPFHPERVAARILGMGDVMSLVEDAVRVVDRDKTEQLAKKLKTGKGFDLDDFRDQMMQMERMGGVAAMLDKLPGVSEIPESARNQVNDKQIKRLVAIINSMTPQERRHPDVIRGSRKRRIAAGSGTQVQEVNRLLKQFDQTRDMMKRMGKGGFERMLGGLKGKIPGWPM